MIPDHIVPLTLEELNYRNGDAILNYALGLIDGDTGKGAEESPTPAWVWFLIVGGTLIGGGFLLFTNGGRTFLNQSEKKKRRGPIKRETGTGRPIGSD